MRSPDTLRRVAAYLYHVGEGYADGRDQGTITAACMLQGAREALLWAIGELDEVDTLRAVLDAAEQRSAAQDN